MLLLSFVRSGFGMWDGRFPVFLKLASVFHKAVFYFLLSLEKMFFQYRGIVRLQPLYGHQKALDGHQKPLDVHQKPANGDFITAS